MCSDMAGPRIAADAPDAIRIDGLAKMYRIYQRPVDRLKQMLWGQWTNHGYGTPFWALQDFSLTIKRGETVGIIGKNGSGKSTLLQMVAGTITPTCGTIDVVGRVAALLELGSGFNPECTGRENIMLNAATLGLTPVQIAERFDDIVAFAEIADFLEQPVKIYSSGMAMRLAFSVAVHIDPEVLIIDEALSVGDARFQQKCLRKMDEIRGRASLLMVTHDLSAVRSFCDRAIWIDSGHIKMQGDPDEVCRAYIEFSHRVANGDHGDVAEAVNAESMTVLPQIPEQCQSSGTREVQVSACGFLDEHGRHLPCPIAGADARFAMRIVASADIGGSLVVGFTMRNRLGEIILSVNSLWAANAAQITCPLPGDSSTWSFRFRMPDFNRGEFTISPAVAVGSQASHVVLHWVHDAIVISFPSKVDHNLPGLLSVDTFTVDKSA